MDETNWPPRFTFTAGGLAGLYLRKYFGDRADAADVGELAALIEDCADKAKEAEREACAKVCEQMNEGQVATHYDWTKTVGSVLASEIRKRSNVISATSSDFD